MNKLQHPTLPAPELRSRAFWWTLSIRLVLALLTAIAALVWMAGCTERSSAAADSGTEQKQQQPQPEAVPPLEVEVVTIAPREVALTRELPGRTSAYRIAEVRARVSGIVQKRFFTEGSDVKEGQVLYQIDPALYEASLKNAQGNLAKSKANAEAARLKRDRYKMLVGKRSISEQDYDDSVAALQALEAEILSGEAAVDTARINLSYTKVTSPVSGRIGASQVTEGAFVQESAATLMATVQQLDPLYVDVTQSSNELLRLRKILASGELQKDKNGGAQVRLLLDDGTEYADNGTLQFADVTVNAGTGMVTMRALFPNPNGDLLPGMFVRARLAEGQKLDAVLVPQSAVARNPKGEPTVFVVKSDGVAELRVLTLGRAMGNEWLVLSGLKGGEQIVVNNLQRVQEGMTVKPISAQGTSPAPAGATRTVQSK
ncbi:MAG: efflux RND transporter periplasmic adaptor subunit [Candidatus Methylacidiphilales bacterium]